MTHIRTLASLLGGLVALVTVPATAEDDARELVRKTVAESGREPVRVSVTLASGRDTRDIEMIRRQFDGSDRIRIDVSAPYHYKGMRYVFVDVKDGSDIQWMYLPAFKRTVRIADAHRNQPFLATQFNVIDLIPPNLDTHTYRFVGEATVAGRACRLVESTPTEPGRSLYGRSVLAIDPVDLVFLRTEFFDFRGEPLKTWSVERLETIDGVLTPVEQAMRSADGDDEWLLRMTEVHYGVDLDEDDFAAVGLGS